MPRRLPPLNSLRAFEAAARHLSFTKAAEELFVTQAAVSHQVKALEDFLGLKLFIRRNRQLILTEQGQVYWPQIRAVFEKLVNATEQIRTSEVSGSLKVSVVPTFATLWLIPRLREFSQNFPEIDVRLTATDSDVDFIKDDIDVAIYYGQSNYPGLLADELMKEFLTPVCAPSLLEQAGGSMELEDLREQLLLHDSNTDEWAKWLHHNGVRGVDLEHGPVFSHSGMVLQAARHGQGIALGHSVLAAMDLSSGRLVKLFDSEIDSGFSYALVCPEEAYDRPKISAFREWLLEAVVS